MASATSTYEKPKRRLPSFPSTPRMVRPPHRCRQSAIPIVPGLIAAALVVPRLVGIDHHATALSRALLFCLAVRTTQATDDLAIGVRRFRLPSLTRRLKHPPPLASHAQLLSVPSFPQLLGRGLAAALAIVVAARPRRRCRPAGESETESGRRYR